MFLTRFAVTAVALATVFHASTSSAHAQQLVGSYVSRLSGQDHFNSQGVRLRSAATIIRQDRANFHEFGRRDVEDGGDRFFASKRNRSLLEHFLANGSATPGTLSAIVNGTPLIRVDIYRTGGSHFIHVTLL